MNKWIWFDLDGTLVDFYNVENWLDYLQQEQTRPYEIAEPLVDCEKLRKVLIALKSQGYSLGIISWLSKHCSTDFARRITKAKLDWLHYYGLTGVFDEILIKPYGQQKQHICEQYCTQGILIDDEQQNLDNWTLGRKIDATRVDIVEELSLYLK